MNKLLDKLIFLILCLAFYFLADTGAYLVVPVIVAVSVSAFNSYFDADVLKLISLAAYVAACMFFPRLLLFLPLICYDIFATRWQWFGALSFLPIAAHFGDLPLSSSILTALFIVLAWFMKRRSVSMESLKAEYVTLQDSAKELLMRFEQKNKDLLERQDYEVNVATLNERNRIAREIHDNVGHLLSSSILQIGALMATCKDETLRGSLNMLKDTLSKGMDSIRSSVHDLHDKSIDLFAEVNALIASFSFCPVTLDYDIEGNPDSKVKYAFIAIVKEALSNIIKHSNATAVRVTLREHPAFYQLVVRDNGTKKAASQGGQTGGGLHSPGIGLKNISDRVAALGGVVNISGDNGYVVFVSVPKE